MLVELTLKKFLQYTTLTLVVAVLFFTVRAVAMMSSFTIEGSLDFDDIQYRENVTSLYVRVHNMDTIPIALSRNYQLLSATPGFTISDLTPSPVAVGQYAVMYAHPIHGLDAGGPAGRLYSKEITIINMNPLIAIAPLTFVSVVAQMRVMPRTAPTPISTENG